jgi:hypothetical protein
MERARLVKGNDDDDDDDLLGSKIFIKRRFPRVTKSDALLSS